jgi:hypothetical protein
VEPAPPKVITVLGYANESKPKSASAGTVSVGEIPLSGETSGPGREDVGIYGIHLEDGGVVDETVDRGGRHALRVSLYSAASVRAQRSGRSL